MKTFPTIFKGQPGPDIEAKDLKEAIFLRDTFLPGHELLVLIEEGELDELDDEL